jgi:hypothetical protein
MQLLIFRLERKLDAILLYDMQYSVPSPFTAQVSRLAANSVSNFGTDPWRYEFFTIYKKTIKL